MLGLPILTAAPPAPSARGDPKVLEGDVWWDTVEHGFAGHFLQAIFAAPDAGPAEDLMGLTADEAGLAASAAVSDDDVLSSLVVRADAAWVAAAQRLSQPHFKLAVRRALRRKLQNWIRESPEAQASDFASFVVRAAQGNRYLQRKGLV